MITTVDRWLLAPAPAKRLAALRILVGGYAVVFLIIRTPGFLQVFDLPSDQFESVGPLAALGEPLAPGVPRVALVLAILLGVAFAAGWKYRVTGPAFAVLFLLLTTYRVSWGHVLHTDHLPAIHVLILGLVPAADAWSVSRKRDDAAADADRYGWPINVMALVTVVVYVLSGIAKLRNGGGDWLTGDILRNQIAYDNLRKILLGDIHSPIGGWLAGVGWVFAPLALFTVVVELGAPIALRAGRLRTAWVGAAWGFHIGIVALMAINFPYELSGVAFTPFFRVERLISAFPGHAGRRWPLLRWRSVARTSSRSQELGGYRRRKL